MKLVITILTVLAISGCQAPALPKPAKCWECTYTIILPLGSDSISLHAQKDMGVYSCDKQPAIPDNAINVKCKQVSKPTE